MDRERPSLDAHLLIEQYGWVRAIARGLVRDRWSAEDVAQETVLAALVAPPPDARDASRMRAWLGRVAFNLARLAARQSTRRRSREELAARDEAQPAAAELWERAAVAASVAEAIVALPEPYRRAVELRYRDGLSMADIAEQTGTTELAVRKRLWRARARLRAALDEDGGRLLPALLALRRLARAARRAPLSGATKLAASLVIALGGALWFSTRAAEPLPREASLLALAEKPGDRPLDALADPSLGPWLGRSPTPGVLESSRRETDRPPDTSPPAPASELRTDVRTRARSLAGRVVDLEGNPLAGLSVLERSHPAEALGTSGPDGGFAVPIPELPASLVARGHGLGPVGAVRVEEGMESWFHLLVAAPVLAVEGTVRDEGARPLEGVRLEVISLDSAWTHLSLPVRIDPLELPGDSSDAAGAFALDEVPRAPGFLLRASLAGYEPEERPALELTSCESIVLRRTPPELLVCGRVLRITGEPSSGAHVRLGLAETRADEDGRFRLAPRGWLEGSTLEAWEEGFEPARVADLGARLGAGRCHGEIELVLGNALETISGTLVDEGGGTVEGWRVAAFALAAPVTDEPVLPAALAWTGASGGFSLRGLPGGEYQLVALESHTLRSGQLARVPAGAAGVELRAPVSLAASIAGRLSTRDGAPLDGARLEIAARLETPSGSWRCALQELQTDARGRFELRADPKAALEIWIEHPAVGKAALLPASESTAELDLALERGSYLRVEGARAEAIAVLDELGRELELRGPAGAGARFTLHDGASPLLLLPAGAREVRLLRSGSEVGRVPIAPRPGEILSVRP